ncbi:tRNA dimethylallyltransferase-like [Nilaparvata lugens]|uniref:tRNA dimethylallyltransferase-like n=1 Tax=Nilaparvata lugens TaxID=108931 RepID=UPI00193E2355|nr:tRNA dimethylallyltransferase-like [Nilaparvata lugens]
MYKVCLIVQVPPVYKLDTSDVEHWTEQVLEPAMEVVMSLIGGGREAGAVRLQPMAVEAATSVASSEESITKVLKQKHEVRHCDVCDRIFIGELQLNDHLKSAKHQKAEKRRKLLELEQQQQSTVT